MSGWYPDPTGRFEFRYHNDRHWTADVASSGQRYIDPLPDPTTTTAWTTPGGPVGPIGQADEGGNGLAIASMVCGIVGITIAWVPFFGIAGLIAALVGLALSGPALKRSKPAGARRGAAIAGLVTSALGIVLGVLGIVLTVYLVRAIDRFDDPGPVDTAITSCEQDGTDVVATGELTNRSGSERDYSVHVRLGTGSSDWVSVEDVPAGGTATFTARELGSFRDRACEVVEVRGPMPFGLDPSLFED